MTNRLLLIFLLGAFSFLQVNAQTEFFNETEFFDIELSESTILPEIKPYTPYEGADLRQTTATPLATYKKPYGFLISGFSNKYTALQAGGKIVSMVRGHAYSSTVWESEKSAANVTVTWTFDKYGTTTVENPSVSYPYLQATPVQTPVLASKSGSKTESFQLGVKGFPNLMAFGGDNQWTLGKENILFGLGNYLPYIDPAYASDMIASKWNAFGAEKKYGNFLGYANRFEKPAEPILIRNVNVLCANPVLASGKSFKINIHSLNAAGEKVKLLHSAETKTMNYVYTDTKNTDLKYYNIPFTFTSDLEIADTDFLVEFLNYESVYALAQGDVRKIPSSESSLIKFDIENYGYLVFEKALVDVPDLYEGWETSFLINLDVVHPFMSAEVESLKHGPDGGKYEFKVKSYWDTGKWKLSAKYPAWITEGTKTFDSSTNTATIPVTVSALPKSTASRTFEIKYTAPGCSVTMQVEQNKDYVSVEELETESFRVFQQGDVYNLEYPIGKFQSVSIYSITGRKIKEYRLNDSGNDLVSASGLATGMYIFRFTGMGMDKSLKVVKR